MIPFVMEKNPHRLKRLVIEPTYACNLRCYHCYVYRSARAVRRMAHIRDTRPVSFWQKVMQSAPEDIHIHFTGGELFAYSEILELLENAASKFSFSISTNGTLLTPEVCYRLADLAPCRVTISILGTETIHDSITGTAGSFRKAARAIEDLIQLLPTDRVSVNFVLLPENASVVADVTKLVEELGATSLVIQLFDPALNRCGIVAGVEKIPPPDYLDWSSVDLASVIQMLDKVQHRASSEPAVLLASSMTPDETIDYVSGVFDVTQWTCAEVFDTMRCSPDGRVYACNGLEIGSLDLHGVPELWHSQRFTAFRQAHLHSVLEPSCKGCCKIRRRSEGQVSQ